MGFDPALLGLGAFGGITSHFMDPRDGCPHKGTDFSSGGTPQPFLAGVYGKVIQPSADQSQWCTIAVQPFNDPAATVQYLHASSVSVAVGNLVAPWTILGQTGQCSPTPVPIHLHVQVFYAGQPSQPCWGSGRNFVNPETWGIQSPLVGTWHASNQGPNYSAVYTLQIDNDSSSGQIGSAQASIHWSLQNAGGGQCFVDTVQIADVICIGIGQKNVMTIQLRGKSASVVGSTCGPKQIAGVDSTAQISLDSSTGLSVGGFGYTKAGPIQTQLLEASTSLKGEMLEATHIPSV
jgi:hypothetical protein